jgi:hypothetical protein
MGGIFGTNRRDEKCVQKFIPNTCREETHGRFRRKRKGNIKMDLKVDMREGGACMLSMGTNGELLLTRQ